MAVLCLFLSFLFLLFWKHSVPVSDAAEAAETALQCHQHRMYQWNRHPDQAEDRRLIHLPRSQIA